MALLITPTPAEDPDPLVKRLRDKVGQLMEANNNTSNTNNTNANTTNTTNT